MDCPTADVLHRWSKDRNVVPELAGFMAWCKCKLPIRTSSRQCAWRDGVGGRDGR